MPGKLSKFELENRVRKMIRKMITKPNKSQRQILADALRKNAKVQPKKSAQA